MLMMTNKIRIIHFMTVIALLFLHKANGKDFYVRSDGDKGVCNYAGYIPGGKKIEISPIQAPTAKLETNVLSKIAGFGGKAATGAMHLGKFTETMGKIAPKLGPALGVFGVAFGVVSDLMKPSPQDILDATNKAIGKLTEEVNNRFTDMVDYVDTELMNAIKERIEVEYKHMMQMFSNCVKEVTLERAVECQEDASRYIRSGFSKFMLLKDNLAKYSESSPPSAKDVKKMELTFLPFREYATLDLMQLQVLKDTYRDDKSLKDRDLSYKRHVKELKEDAEKLINYAKDMAKWILFIHDTHARKQCKITKTTGSRCTAEGSWSGNTACFANAKCQFDITNSVTKNCLKRQTVRADDKEIYKKYNFPSNYGHEQVGKLVASNRLDESHEAYVDQLARDVKNYWQSEVLSSVSTWEQIRDQAVEELSKLEDDISIVSGNSKPQNFNILQKVDDLETSYEFMDTPNDKNNIHSQSNKVNHQYDDEKSKYPMPYDFEYVNSNDEMADHISTKYSAPLSPLGKYEEVRNDMMLLDDTPVSPRFKERYLRAFDTLKYFEDRDK